MVGDQDVLDIAAAAECTALRQVVVHNSDLVVLADLQEFQREVPDADGTFGDEDDKGMAAVVGDHMVVLSEVLPNIPKTRSLVN